MPKTATTTEATRAKRGDLVVIHCKSTYSEGDNITVATVTSITRDGKVKGYLEAGYGGILFDRKIDLKSLRSRDKPVGFVRLYLIEQGRINVEAAMKTARENPWPHNGSPGMYYESLDQVKAALKPHLCQPASATS